MGDRRALPRNVASMNDYPGKGLKEQFIRGRSEAMRRGTRVLASITQIGAWLKELGRTLPAIRAHKHALNGIGGTL